MVVVIPAYEPNEELENLVSELNCMNYRIVIVNDGSSSDKNVIFERLKDKATILHHTVNYGKGRAIKTALHYISEHMPEESGVVTVDADGQFMYPDDTGNPAAIGIQFGLYQFTNPSGLDKTSGGLLAATDASGAALNESVDQVTKKSQLKQGYLEGSNVNVATEMVNLITAQRAYELNSKAINASDEMLQQANQLYRS